MRSQPPQSYDRIQRRCEHVATAARHVIECLEARVLLSAGQPDPTFGINGVVTTSFAAGAGGVFVSGMVLQPDGKTLVIGDTGPLGTQSDPETSFRMMRYTSAGTLDNSFGQGGIVSVPGGTNGRAVAVQPDGKILVSGNVGGPTGSALMRYTASGLPDSSFGAGGNVPTDIWHPEIAVRPDGRIILAGSNTMNSVWCTELASYLPSGQPDPSFGTGGKLLISTGPDAGGVTAMTLQPDGKIDFVGTYNFGDWYLARLNADGTHDSSFGARGTVVTDFLATALTCESGGDIIVAGDAPVGDDEYSALAFYTPSGALDVSRGTAGKVITSFGSRNFTAAVAVQPADGKIVLAAGVGVGVGSEDLWALARYTPAGSLDPTFGTGGISVSKVLANSSFDRTMLAGMGLQDDGKIVLAGTRRFAGLEPSEGDFVVARYLGDGGPRVSTPFSGQPVSVPAATIEAENFDSGGEGVAYYDTTPQNVPGKYRNTAVDVGADPTASNGFAVLFTFPGEWLDYSITAPSGGTYVLQSRVANFKVGGTFHIEIDGADVTGVITVPDTGPWDTWQTIRSRAFTMSAGTHVMQVVMDGGGYWGNVGDFDSFRFAAAGQTSPTPFLGHPFNISTDTIEAENFDNGGEGVAYHDTTPLNVPGKYRAGGVDIGAVANASNTLAVGYTYPGEWLTYTITAPASGRYALQTRFANYRPGGTFHVEIDGTNVTGTLKVPDTGPWDTWYTRTSSSFSVSAGAHRMKVVMDRGGYWGNVGDFDSFRFVSASAGPTPFLGHPFTGLTGIDAEDFDNGGEGVAYHDTTPQNLGGQFRNTAVDITAGGSSGYHVGYTAPGEWLLYSVANPTAGQYVIWASVASYKPGGKLHVEIDGENVTGALTVPDTGGWNNYRVLISRPFAYSAGNHTMRVVMDSGGYWGTIANFDWFEIIPT